MALVKELLLFVSLLVSFKWTAIQQFLAQKRSISLITFKKMIVFYRSLVELHTSWKSKLSRGVGLATILTTIAVTDISGTGGV